MSVTGVSGGRKFQFSRPISKPPPPPSRFASTDGDNWLALQRDTSRLREEVNALRRLLGPGKSQTAAGIAFVSSTGGLGLATDATGSIRRSTEAVNNTNSSYDPVLPSWTGDSTSEPMMGGTYEGTVYEEFTFEVIFEQVPGMKSAQVEVRNADDEVVDTLTIGEDDYGTKVFSLSSGMTVTFGEGDLLLGDTFQVNAYPNAPTDVVPGNPFNGTGGSDPKLEPGLPVVDGSFKVNGIEISVSGDDSIHTVLARISDLTNVTASFDPDTQTVILENRLLGDEPIDLTDDTSGFVASMKLAGSVLEPGLPRESEQPMANLAQFAGVSAGTITVNGATISFDPAVDSLVDVFDRIEDSGAKVNTILVDENRVTFRNHLKGVDLTLADSGTGFLAALGLPEGTIEPERKGTGRGVVGAPARKMADATAEIGRLMNKIMGMEAEGAILRASVSQFGAESRKIAARSFGFSASASLGRSSFGIDFQLGNNAKTLFDASTATKRSFTKAIGRDYESFRSAWADPRAASGRSFLDDIDRMARDLHDKARTQFDLTL